MRTITRGRSAALLLGVVLAFPAFFGASWAKDQVVSGYPQFSEGDELWARKTGTTNTKQDLESTAGALHVFSTGGTAPPPPTGASATEVQGTAATGAAAIGKPLQTGIVRIDSGAMVPLKGNSDGAILTAGNQNGNYRTMAAGSGGEVVVSRIATGADGYANTKFGEHIDPVSGAHIPATLPMVFNGSTWDRMRGDTAGLDVTVTRAPAPCNPDTDNDGLTGDTTLEAATANLRMCGYTVRESAGTAATATVILRRGVVSGTCTGSSIAKIELDPNQSSQMWYGDRGFGADAGVCADVISGTVDVTIFLVSEANP